MGVLTSSPDYPVGTVHLFAPDMSREICRFKADAWYSHASTWMVSFAVTFSLRNKKARTTTLPFMMEYSEAQKMGDFDAPSYRPCSQRCIFYDSAGCALYVYERCFAIHHGLILEIQREDGTRIFTNIPHVLTASKPARKNRKK